MNLKKYSIEQIIKFIISFFMILQPFLDTYYLYTEQTIHIFKFSPATIIRFGVIGLLIIYELIKYIKTKKCIPFILTIATTILYIIFHHICALNFKSVSTTGFNYSLFKDIFYIFRLTLPIFIILTINDFKFSIRELYQIIQFSNFIVCFIIVFSNILKIGLGSYNNVVICDNFISWFNGIYDTYSFMSLASKGWFNFANQIAALIVIFLPFSIYIMFKKPSIFNFVIVALSMLSGLILGTKVALYGVLADFFIMFFIYFISIIINRSKIKINWPAVIFSILLLIAYLIIIPHSPAKNRQHITNTILDNEKNIETISDTNLIDESNHIDDTIDLTALINEIQTVKQLDKDTKIDFISRYYKYFRIDSGFIENSYPYILDPDFWLDIMENPLENRMNYRFIEQKIIQRISLINGNPSTILWGISYSRVQNVFNIEKDFVAQYYTVGIIGILLFIAIPYIIIPINFTLYIIKHKKITISNIMLLLSIAMFLGISYCSGNVIDALTITIYMSLILGVMTCQILQKEER